MSRELATSPTKRGVGSWFSHDGATMGQCLWMLPHRAVWVWVMGGCAVF